MVRTRVSRGLNIRIVSGLQNQHYTDVSRNLPLPGYPDEPPTPPSEAQQWDRCGTSSSGTGVAGLLLICAINIQSNCPCTQVGGGVPILHPVPTGSVCL